MQSTPKEVLVESSVITISRTYNNGEAGAVAEVAELIECHEKDGVEYEWSM